MAGYEGLSDKSSGKFGEVSERRSTTPLKDLDFLREVKKDLTVAREQCYQRGLLQTTKWLAGG